MWRYIATKIVLRTLCKNPLLMRILGQWLLVWSLFLLFCPLWDFSLGLLFGLGCILVWHWLPRPSSSAHSPQFFIVYRVISVPGDAADRIHSQQPVCINWFCSFSHTWQNAGQYLLPDLRLCFYLAIWGLCRFCLYFFVMSSGLSDEGWGHLLLVMKDSVPELAMKSCGCSEQHGALRWVRGGLSVKILFCVAQWLRTGAVQTGPKCSLLI